MYSYSSAMPRFFVQFYYDGRAMGMSIAAYDSCSASSAIQNMYPGASIILVRQES